MSEKGKKFSGNLSKLYLLLAVVIFIWILFSILLPKIEPSLANRAILGDSYGTINSLFSGLAFSGIIYTILLQRKELALQREELIHTRKELSRSADAQENLELQQKRQAENLKITAKLNALNSLLTYYSNEEIRALDLGTVFNSKKEKEICVNRIKQILKIKES